MDDVLHIPTRNDRLEEILNEPYSKAVDEIKNILYGAIDGKKDVTKSGKKEIRKRVIEYIVGHSGPDNPVVVDDISLAVEKLDKDGLDEDTIKNISDKYRSMIGTMQQRHLSIFIKRKEVMKSGYGKRKAVFYLNTDAVNAFNEKYHGIAEFVEMYKGDLKELLLDELSKSN